MVKTVVTDSLSDGIFDMSSLGMYSIQFGLTLSTFYQRKVDKAYVTKKITCVCVYFNVECRPNIQSLCYLLNAQFR